jgi:hypothetical protein
MFFFEKKHQKLFLAGSAASPRRSSHKAEPSSDAFSELRARSARGKFFASFL